MATLREKHEELCAALLAAGSVLVAYSGGVDSTLLLHVARDVLGARAVAATVSSSFMPERELLEARAFCSERGIEHLVVDVDVLSDEDIAANSENRCYLCKRKIFESLLDIAGERGLQMVADGSNVDDAADFRPGARALAELGVSSPLAEAGFTKADVRELACQLDLDVWSKPSLACLASRVPFGDAITAERLQRIDAAEKMLLDAGLTQVRVRDHGDIARIEAAPSELNMLVGLMRSGLSGKLHGLGFAYVTIDADGYRTGSLNPR